MHLHGLAPFTPPHLPRSRARWWCAIGQLDGDTLRMRSLTEHEDVPAVDGSCGLCAPCSLPPAFVEFAGDIAGHTPSRLMALARDFAAKQTRGNRYPRRTPEETASALERHRLVRFCAARPLLKQARPWNADGRVFEVDAPLWLHRLDLPSTRYAGTSADAITRRARILSALHEGVLGFAVDVEPRDFAVASAAALEAVIACAAAAWVHIHAPECPGPDASAWIPAP